jgi:hypothetical protein
MKKKMSRKLALTTETLHSLDAPTLGKAEGAAPSNNSNCGESCFGTCGCQSYPYSACTCSGTCP